MSSLSKPSALLSYWHIASNLNSQQNNMQDNLSCQMFLFWGWIHGHHGGKHSDWLAGKQAWLQSSSWVLTFDPFTGCSESPLPLTVLPKGPHPLIHPKQSQQEPNIQIYEPMGPFSLKPINDIKFWGKASIGCFTYERIENISSNSYISENTWSIGKSLFFFYMLLYFLFV